MWEQRETERAKIHMSRIAYEYFSSTNSCATLDKAATTMSNQPYTALPGGGHGETIPLNDTPPAQRKRSLSLSSGSDSDVSYRDPMDIEPFDEKQHGHGNGHGTYMDEGEEEAGYAIEPRRVCCHLRSQLVSVGVGLTGPG